MLREEWRPIPGYEKDYSVSSLGRIRRETAYGNRPPQTIRKLSRNRSNGYLCVSLTKNGKAHYHTVHSLVAGAFIGPCPDGMTVNHIDLDKDNNAPENLEYLMPAMNMHHAIRGGTGPRGSCLNERKVASIRGLANIGLRQRVIAKAFGVSQVTISNIVRRKTWKHVPAPNH